MRKPVDLLLLLLAIAATATPALAEEIRGLELLRHPHTGQEVFAIWNGEPGNFYCVPAEDVVVVISTATAEPTWARGPGNAVVVTGNREFFDHVRTVITADLSCS